MENPANPLLVGTERPPALNDDERDAVIKIGAAGGVLARHHLGNAVQAALLRTQVIAPSGPGAIELTPRGIQVLADTAKVAVQDA